MKTCGFSSSIKRRPLGVFCGVALGLVVLCAAGSAAATIPVIVNGQQVQFDTPPIERSGRVFVPLRGVFEKLGASVVYDNGLINATGDGRSIQLRIGSTTATVDGNTQQLEVAPFLVGPRTYVPLRFISEALGATVDWNDNTQTVSIFSGSQSSAGVQLLEVTPASGSVVAAQSPAVSATFSSAVDPNSVHITLDGRDVSTTTDISGTNFLFTPPYALTAQQHTVRVSGTSTSGTSFVQSWSFTSGTSVVGNYLRNLSPSNGSTVGSTFTISGRTIPNSAVHLVVIPTAVFGGVFAVTSGTYVADVTADSNGLFSQVVNVQTVAGGKVGVRITSVAPSKESATVSLSLNS